MNGDGRVLPAPTPISAPFWEGCARGELGAQRCEPCGEWIFPPLPACPRCLRRSPAWIAGSGVGEVYSYSVVHRPQLPALSVPYLVVLVELQEGWRMLSNLIECRPEDLTIGLPVRVAFRAVGGVTLPFFTPADPALRTVAKAPGDPAGRGEKRRKR